MPLSRLENFLVNTDGNILYVNPSDLDATDSFDNKGNSLTRPFVTVQRALLESARFCYQSGLNNDRYDKTTILLYPGTHYIDNRPGYYIRDDSGAVYYDVNENVVSSPNVELTSGTNFDLNSSSNVLYKFNSVDGGVVIPKGTSIVGLDLRKTKVKPLYVPDPTKNDSAAADYVPRSAIFRVTGGCYFWQFSIFDADRAVYYSKNFSQLASPNRSHHKLTCFEYCDGINTKDKTGLTDLAMYYYKVMNAYGDDTGNREIVNFPLASDFEPNSPEYKIVGDLADDNINISNASASGTIATIETASAHGLTVDDSIRIIGVGSALYNGSNIVTGITSERKFSYLLASTPIDTNIVPPTGTAQIVIEPDNVSGSSPYIFNCSLRSTYGMCGLHADGDKATGFKSMVVAQFTGIGLQKDDNAFLRYDQGTGIYDDPNSLSDKSLLPFYIRQDAIYNPSYESAHIKASNDAFIQAVSTFAIGFAHHFVSKDGSDQSITNSNSNFGAKSLVSTGFRKSAFKRDDTGYITHIVPPKDLQEPIQNVIWKPLNPEVTVSAGTTQRLYLLGEDDETNPPSNIVTGYRVGSKKNEKMYLQVNIGGVNFTHSSPLLMQVPGNVDGPASEKRFVVNTVDHTTGNDSLTFVDNHNFFTGESVRVYSDTGVVPDGLENEAKYYVINTGAKVIKLAKTVNDANSSIAVDIKNANGGMLSIVSRVTDKLPGELGHPVQFDSTLNNWYVIGAASTATNKIYDSFVGYSTQIAAKNSSVYVQRKSENRDLDDRIYKLRYVIPQNTTYTGKAPNKNYVLQESSTVTITPGEEEVLADINSNRNPRVIAGITTSNLLATVTTELPHKLSAGDRIHISKVSSTQYPDPLLKLGFNGYFYIVSTPSTKTFTYNIAKPAGTFTNNVSVRGQDLPSYSRNEYDTSYTIQNVEEVQEYIREKQDGIYYITCLIGNITPTASQFIDKKFRQNIVNLYPTNDVDNLNVDPVQAISVANNQLIGKVQPNDSLNSITKEGILEYMKDNRVGLAVTGGIGGNHTSGVATVFTTFNHNLNSITTLAIDAAGAGYGPSGIATVLHNVPLVGSGITGRDATANVHVNASNQVASVQIVDGGSAYGIGNTMVIGNLGQTTNAIVSVSAINNVSGKSVQIIGVGTDRDRNNGLYNGLYKITDVPSANSISYNRGTNPGIYTATTPNGVIYVVDEAIGISSVNGIGTNTSNAGIVTITTSDSHGLFVGNKIKITAITGVGATIYNDDFIVQGVGSTDTFTITSNIGLTTTAGFAAAELYKYGLVALGQDSSLADEKIAGSLLPLSSGGFRTQLVGSATTSGKVDNINVKSAVGIKTGDFLQINNEIVRVRHIEANLTQIDLLRGTLGTKATDHAEASIVRKIDVIPSEVRRFSSIRASGHTFEYLGYGPGNYSTALPQRHQRTITLEEELLAISTEQKGGVVFYSGMNDRGDFFSGERVTPRENVLGEDLSDLSAVFDDVYIRNTLRVGGGSNRNLPSEFRGPVNFTNKITSTARDGIEAIKLLLKGNPTQNPSFQVGSDTDPTFIIKDTSQFVGIRTESPRYEFDVEGTIRANIYENFKLSDLPNTPTEEVTFKRNRVLKVNEAGDGYELVDVHELDAYALRSLNVSNDGTVYSGIGVTVQVGGVDKLQVSGIDTSRFYVGEALKVFGVQPAGLSTIPPTQTATVARVGSVSEPQKYNYWIAQYHLTTGMVGVATQASFGGEWNQGIGHTSLGNFNDLNHVTLNLTRDTTDYGILVYRQEQILAGVSTNINNAKLIGILGDKEFSNGTTVTWKDFGPYDQTAWSGKGTSNEFLGIGDTTTPQIHFPNIATTGFRRGWSMDSVVSISPGSITLGNAYGTDANVGFGTTSVVKVVHDNTYSLTDAIDKSVASGGNYLELPSGTYLAEKVIIPSQFTLKGNGRNSVIKQQYYSNDLDVGIGTELSQDGNFVGVGTTAGPQAPSDGIPQDLTIQDLTIDGNATNNYNYEDPATSFSSDNYLVYLKDVKSTLLKGVEVRNSPAGGVYVRDSRRLSVENCAFVDGCLSDRYSYQPIDAQGSQSMRINDSLFENYPGPLDVSTTQVVGVGGNIIRNCGTGLRTYATGKITTTDNIILGPADEWIPSPDIYDSDFNSINVTIDNGSNFESPVYLYVEEGNAKDISSGKVSVTGGIGTMLNVGGGSSETVGPFMSEITFAFDTPNVGEFGRENGYIKWGLTTAVTANLGVTSAYGYEIKGTEYMEKPVGYTTYVGIGTGDWVNTGIATNKYFVVLDDRSQYSGISTGDIVQLVGHNCSPSLNSAEFTVEDKNINAGIASLRLIASSFGLDGGVSIASTVGQVDGTRTGYISIRNVFTIAKGRVGVI